MQIGLERFPILLGRQRTKNLTSMFYGVGLSLENSHFDAIRSLFSTINSQVY